MTATNSKATSGNSQLRQRGSLVTLPTDLADQIDAALGSAGARRSSCGYLLPVDQNKDPNKDNTHMDRSLAVLGVAFWGHDESTVVRLDDSI